MTHRCRSTLLRVTGCDFASILDRYPQKSSSEKAQWLEHAMPLDRLTRQPSTINYHIDQHAQIATALHRHYLSGNTWMLSCAYSLSGNMCVLSIDPLSVNIGHYSIRQRTSKPIPVRCTTIRDNLCHRRQIPFYKTTISIFLAVV